MAFGKHSKIRFIGAGNVGTSLAVALDKKGYNVVSAASRTFQSAVNLSSGIQGCDPERNTQRTVDVSEVVFVTTPDDTIAHVLKSLQFKKDQLVIHCSGVSSLDLFDDVNLPWYHRQDRDIALDINSIDCPIEISSQEGILVARRGV